MSPLHRYNNSKVYKGVPRIENKEKGKMNTNFMKLIMALALVSKASPFGIARYTADFIAKENRKSRAREIEEKRASIAKTNAQILRQGLANSRIILTAMPQKLNPKYAGIAR